MLAIEFTLDVSWSCVEATQSSSNIFRDSRFMKDAVHKFQREISDTK